jgi:nucleoside diphosphate kinase
LYAVRKNGFKIKEQKNVQFTSDMVDEFYAEHIGKSFYENLKECTVSGVSTMLILERNDAVKQWRQLIGPTNVVNAKLSYPYTLRALYGDTLNTAKNVCHGSDNVSSVKTELEFFKKCVGIQ